ncbi:MULTISPECIES: class I SAM-dependent methyltransferase [Streptomycetaceae]|uniref:Methyltransferase type 11 domain-containing protein n=1 Tax=Streptantibioticus cattleyicolor (strain ATCC 35852 / DSM 46488 / JCM 4925 / NBRC 14057 / NRRL 8057) TaxID=1003195 RepID=F8JPP2_STREN|nr:MULTISPECIES: class I SAM-dependent methyltransferase [Streptomycetaceae]AEW92734.1 hypothetical protein SCATT_03630 [Streptantibioticus cattleyicolor NRRL 8057 = DSM 46488]MYS57500.1 methyltransferase domain-containing protein [Streptomyces sp. SID5468]CCB73088.1 conserved protein of unknown function [Streptantibioticus cattleyicolor NRRL 8057 = DSM 46488]
MGTVTGRPGREPVRHPLFARWYARCAPGLDRRAGMPRYREESLAGLSGRVLEIGAGSGLNFRHYPREVSEVVAVEPERRLRGAAIREGLRLGIPVDVVPGVAEALPVKSEAFDAAVATLVLCSVRDQRRALLELHRVLRPGGQLRLLEHVRARGRAGVAAQWALDHTVWPLLFGGCRTARDTLAQVAAAGFEVGEVRRPRLRGGASMPVVLATAYRR